MITAALCIVAGIIYPEPLVLLVLFVIVVVRYK